MGKKFTDTLFFLLVVCAAAAITFYIGKDQPLVMMYNFVFLGIMVLVYLIGMFEGMFRLNNLSGALKRAADEVKNIFKKPGKADLSHLQVLEGIFDNRYLDRRMDNFSSNVSSTLIGLGDIEDYISEEEIDIYVHKRLLEMVPDIFTSLGILGTFVGLVWGLKDFNPTGYEAMTTSVASLVDGIKVAFLTSIYGIAFSIVYTTCMKTEYSAMSQNLTIFLERFHAYVLPSAENESRNLLVASQKVQTNAMHTLAQQFSTQLAGSFEKVITPTFEKMNSSMDVMLSTVTQCQEEAVRQIVDEFLRQMNENFRLQMEDFNETLIALNEAQRQMAEYSRSLYQSLSTELSNSFVSQEKILQDIVEKMASAQTEFTESAGQILKQNQEIQKAQQSDYEQVVKFLRESEASAAKFWVACNQTMQKYLDSAAEEMEKASQIESKNEELISSSQEIAKTFSETMKEYAQYQALNYKTMEKVRVLLSDISVAKKGDQDVFLVGNSSRNESLTRIERLLTEQSEATQQGLNEINKTLREATRGSQKGKLGGLFK
ncbi:MAG: MotA/TolQ/ExbB proton channel family protein [Blautia sp.]|nr:MotA/TolQ/ExbB proton channel family protein [Blautia sp.]